MLSEKQKKFCREYQIDLNATQAAIRAGYSKKTANEQGARLLANVSIQAFMKTLIDAQVKRTEITADMVIKELAKVGFANLQDYVKAGFSIEDIQELERDHAAAIESIRVKQTGGDYPSTEINFKLHDKISALEKLGRHLGIFEKDNEQSKTDNNITFTETILSKKV